SASSTAFADPCSARPRSRARAGGFSTRSSANQLNHRIDIPAAKRRRSEGVMASELGTTNLLLGIMAAVSVLEAVLLVGAGVAGVMLYQRVSSLLSELESRHVAPAMTRVNAILDDVKSVSATVKDETTRVDYAIRSTMARVDDTADRVRS